MKIKILPDAVINRIAAGEVVDRPVSVVRELVDNAVDAGATDVLIEIEQGGKNLIRICDDGCGMSKADVLLALERHATSKISDDADLQKIETLGFRGEALPSIAAVSRILIKTRERSSELGTKLVAEAGTVADLSAAAMSAGTEISITSLFFNTPARKKFLKSDHTEDRQIQRWLRSYSLAHPKIRFRLILNGKESINISAANSFKDRAKQLFGERAFYVHKAVGAFLLEGYLMHPGIAPDSSVDFTVVVNNRVVSDRAIFRAVKDAYGSMLKHFESPAGVVQLTMPGWMVDVNVHPQKSEVRFRQAGEIFKLVYEATADSLTGLKASSLVSQPGLSIAVNSGGNNEVLSAALQLKQIEPQDQSLFCSVTAGWEQSKLDFTNKAQQQMTSSGQGADFQSPHSIDRPKSSNFYFSELIFRAQVLGCFLVCEYNNSLVVIDLHAAHERINYNQIRKQILQRKVVSQLLLIPEVVEVGSRLVEDYLELRETLENCGFEIDTFGADRLVIRAVPSILANKGLDSIIKELLNAQAITELKASFSRIVDYIAARLACHASLRSGDIIKAEEAQALFHLLDNEELGAACPHGRPVLVNFLRTDVESWFGRDK